MSCILSYTREPADKVYYDPKLAYSMHLAISEDGVNFTALNHNSGVLFARALENADGSLEARCLDAPHIVKDGEGYLVYAYRCFADWEDEGESGSYHARRDPYECIIAYRTDNFVDYKYLGETAENEELRKLMASKPSGALNIGTDGVVFNFDDGAAGRSADDLIHPWSKVEISEKCADYLRKKLMPRYNSSIVTAESVRLKAAGNGDSSCRGAGSPFSAGSSLSADGEALSDISQLTATAFYSDGTSAVKQVEWDMSAVDLSKPGQYELTGQVVRPHFPFPVAYDRADPCIGKYKGKYYFIATNDADGNHSLYIREADTIGGLVGAEEHLILDTETYPDIKGLLWAPEFHMIGSRFCILHAATQGHFFQEESCIMILREGGDPCCRADWSKPERIKRADGSDICEAGREITLDMTSFTFNGKDYAVWSERQFLPKDLGAWLYIAELNRDDPGRLASEPVVLSKPDYSWGNNHTFVEEGPFTLHRNGILYLTFSAAAVDTSYVVGMLSIPDGRDPLVPANWKKKGFPLLTSRCVNGEFGTGHNAYAEDENGDIWNSYHAHAGADGPRSSGIRRVHFDIDGEPVLDLTEEDDVRDELRTVRTRLIIE